MIKTLITRHFTRYLLNQWYNLATNAQPDRWLRALSALTRYHINKQAKHRRPPSQYRTPLIVVGNITAGGNGKTPFVAALARHLTQQGECVGIICRGDGGVDNRYPQHVTSPYDTQFGDEARLHASLGYLTWQGRSRHDVAQALLKAHPEVSIIISDDGLQHHALHRDISLALISAERGLGNGWLLPAGPLREPIERLFQLDALVIHHATPQHGKLHPSVSQLLQTPSPPLPPAFHTHLQLSPPYQLHDSSPVHHNAGAIAALTTIAHPQHFFESLETLGIHVDERLSFPDHHRLNAQDIAPLYQHAAVFITEKDAIKCHDFPNIAWWVIPSSIELPSALIQLIHTLLKH